MKKVIIFGACGYGLYTLYSLDDAEFEMLCFIDNSKDLQGKNYYGYYVDAPENISNYDYDYIILAVAKYADAMRTQLVSPPLSAASNQIIEFHPNVDRQAGSIIWHDLRVATLRRCIEEIRENNVQGNLAELGVYKGDFAKYLNRYLPDRKLYLFDTFTGFDDRDVREVNRQLKDRSVQFTDTSVEMVLNKMYRAESCVVRKGYFPESAVGLEDETYCLVSLDADFYKPILAGLEYFYPRLSPGGYIFVHDFVSRIFKDGVKAAVRKYCLSHGISYVPLLDEQGSVIISK